MQVETAVEERTVDKSSLIYIAGARLGVSIVRRLLLYGRRRGGETLERRIRAHYSGYTFEAYARLDVPTFSDPIIQRQLDNVTGGRSSVAWESLQMLTELISTLVQLVSQISVLFAVLREHNDGLGIAMVSCLPALMHYARYKKFLDFGGMYVLSCKPI